MKQRLISALPPTVGSSEEVATELLINSSFIDKSVNFIHHAKSRIWICAYTWRWYESAPEKDIQLFNAEMVKALQRGVDVRAIMHNRAQTAFLQSLGFKVRLLNTKKTMHTKAIMIDSSTLILGSHNLTEKGTAENFEVSVVTQELEPVLQFETYFDKLWESYTK